MIRAAITPGTQPQSHKMNTIIIEPQPLSNTAKGGQTIESNSPDTHLLKLLIDEFIRRNL